MFKKTLHLSVLLCFFWTTLGPLPKAHAAILGLPAPGAMVHLSPAYQPVIIRGLTVHKDNPFLFDFLVDVGQDNMQGTALKKEGEKLIKYFLAGLAIPDKDLWVNLSPYEKNRMIPEALGQTDMGRDLLEQDYILKQITASLIYPEKKLGKIFWDRVYSKAQAQYGTTRIPVNTFNKVWIMADHARVFEHNQTAFVIECHLKVMLEEDYLALTHHQQVKSHSVASQIVRQIVLPELEKEVNTGKNFSALRQIFNSVVLSTWYKKRLKQALLTQVYADQSKIKGINLKDPAVKEQIYEQYLEAYKKGVFNYIKEDINHAGERIPRKYFSGGTVVALGSRLTINDGALAANDLAMMENKDKVMDFATIAIPTKRGSLIPVLRRNLLASVLEFADAAMHAENPPLINTALDKLDVIMQSEPVPDEAIRDEILGMIRWLKQYYLQLSTPELEREFQKLHKGMAAVISRNFKIQKGMTHEEVLVSYLDFVLERIFKIHDILSHEFKSKQTISWEKVTSNDNVTVPKHRTYVYQYPDVRVNYAVPLWPAIVSKDPFARFVAVEDRRFVEQLVAVEKISNTLLDYATYDERVFTKTKIVGRLTQEQARERMYPFVWAIAEHYGMVRRVAAAPIRTRARRDAAMAPVFDRRNVIRGALAAAVFPMTFDDSGLKFIGKEHTKLDGTIYRDIEIVKPFDRSISEVRDFWVSKGMAIQSAPDTSVKIFSYPDGNNLDEKTSELVPWFIPLTVGYYRIEAWPDAESQKEYRKILYYLDNWDKENIIKAKKVGITDQALPFKQIDEPVVLGTDFRQVKIRILSKISVADLMGLFKSKKISNMSVLPGYNMNGGQIKAGLDKIFLQVGSVVTLIIDVTPIKLDFEGHSLDDFFRGFSIPKIEKGPHPKTTNAAQLSGLGPGGIDLNAQHMEVSNDGQGVRMNLDSAMLAHIREYGIDSLSAVVIRMTPVASLWAAAGLQKN